MGAQTVMAYPPVPFDSQEDYCMLELQAFQNMKTFLRVDLLQALHHSVKLRCERLSAFALKGISCTAKLDKRYLFHFVLTSYIVDLPESQGYVKSKEWLVHLLSVPCLFCYSDQNGRLSNGKLSICEAYTEPQCQTP